MSRPCLSKPACITSLRWWSDLKRQEEQEEPPVPTLPIAGGPRVVPHTEVPMQLQLDNVVPAHGGGGGGMMQMVGTMMMQSMNMQNNMMQMMMMKGGMGGGGGNRRRRPRGLSPGVL